MQDIPVFTTENGVASLIFKEIPYTSTAYVIMQSSLEPELFLLDCITICRMAGAESVVGSGHVYLERYPFITSIVEMQCMAESLGETDAALFPVQEKTLRTWQEIYNRKMHGVPNASHMSDADAKKMLERGDGYFVHRGEKLLGIGIAAGERIDAVASNVPGSGEDIVLALGHAITSEIAKLEVASANRKAIGLYERLGFVIVREISRWYKIF